MRRNTYFYSQADQYSDGEDDDGGEIIGACQGSLNKKLTVIDKSGFLSAGMNKDVMHAPLAIKKQGVDKDILFLRSAACKTSKHLSANDFLFCA
jgi:hypothetical protein